MIYFTADTHFNHSNIINLCGRPFANLEQMNNKLRLLQKSFLRYKKAKESDKFVIDKTNKQGDLRYENSNGNHLRSAIPSECKF